jgi:hypothetical protein
MLLLGERMFMCQTNTNKNDVPDEHVILSFK